MKRKTVFEFRSQLTVVTLALMLTACNDNDIVDPIIDVEDDQLAYVAFNESIDHKWVAKYSVAGIETALSDGTKNAHVSSIVVSDNDVYASGYAQSSKNQYYATYWKNNVAILLTDSTSNLYALAEDIAVSDGDVYVAGSMFNCDHVIAVYWKNGTAVQLSDGKTDSYARSIFISGSDVYVAGSVMNKPFGGVSEARYWKNGEEIKLEGSYASSIFVVDNTVYVAGSFGTTPHYFKNGIAVPLNEARNMGTSDIFANSENIYVAGPGMYWNNNTKKSLMDNGVEPNVHALYVLDDQVYIGGSIRKNGKYIARYWKNDKAIDLTDGNNNAGVTSIFVVKK